MKFLVAVVLSLTTLLLSAQQACPVLPTPASYKTFPGKFELHDVLRVNAIEMDRQAFAFLEHELKTQFNIQAVPEVSLHQHNGWMYSCMDTHVRGADFFQNDSIQPGAYTLKANEFDHIDIYYGDGAGCFNAINTLLQLFASAGKDKAIQACEIQDSPKFDWRGLHLDVSRHFFTVEEIKGFLDLMALYKFNTFHWHLTDDQGWRIEIKKYPKLTEVGAWRDSTVIGHYTDKPRRYEKEKYGGFYSQSDVREIVKYAADRYITVVPEIEMPGHSRAALAAYPEYSCTGEFQPVPGLWGIFDDIYCSKKASIDFMKDILSEVLELFPSEYIHIGGDEAPKYRWKRCEECQKVITENGLHDEHELQSYFIRQIDAFLTENGRKLIGWDEILEGGLSPNAAVMSWRGEKGGIEAAKQKHEVVMSPTTYCYFDYYQSGHTVEPLAIGGFLPLEKVYKYNPVPKELSQEEARYVLGGQANIWTEYIQTMDHVEYMAFPRALALMQSLWCEEKPSYEEFLATYIEYHEDYLDAHDVNFARSIHYPIMNITRGGFGINVRFRGASDTTAFKVEHFNEGDFDSPIAETVSAKNAFAVERVKDVYEKRVFFQVTSDKFEEKINYEVIRHSALGLPVELITPPHPKYSNNGSLNLVDGIVGRRPWKGNEWLGFQLNQVEMIVDLGAVSTSSQLDIGLLEKNGSWIYLPESITVSGSVDKQKWKKLGSVQKKSITEKTMISLKSKKTRYLKIVIDAMEEIPEGMGGAGNVPWTFIDELFIDYKKK